MLQGKTRHIDRLFASCVITKIYSYYMKKEIIYVCVISFFMSRIIVDICLILISAKQKVYATENIIQPIYHIPYT